MAAFCGRPLSCQRLRFLPRAAAPCWAGRTRRLLQTGRRRLAAGGRACSAPKPLATPSGPVRKTLWLLLTLRAGCETMYPRCQTPHRPQGTAHSSDLFQTRPKCD